MIQLDSKDKKIVYYLIQNSRQSLRSIGKKVGISKELVSYRIRRLEKNQVILNFRTIDNFLKLGYAVISNFYKFVNINPSKKEEILEYLIKNKNTFYISLIDGMYDLQVDSFSGDLIEYERFLDELRTKYHNNLSLQHSMIPIKVELHNYLFLLNETINLGKPLDWPIQTNLVKIDELDYKILAELSNNSRIPTKNIANNLKSTVTTINHRINNLIKQEVILQFTINVDWLKIGYRFFHLQINLNDFSKKNQIINYMRNNPHLIRIYQLLMPDIDIHFTLLLKNMEELRKIIEDITIKFPNAIKDHRFYSAFKICKHNFMVPKILKIKHPINFGYI